MAYSDLEKRAIHLLASKQGTNHAEIFFDSFEIHLNVTKEVGQTLWRSFCDLGFIEQHGTDRGSFYTISYAAVVEARAMDEEDELARHPDLVATLTDKLRRHPVAGKWLFYSIVVMAVLTAFNQLLDAVDKIIQWSK